MKTRRSISSRSRGRDDRYRRIGAHAAGVRADVAVADALVVLRRLQQHDRPAIADRQDGGLLPAQAFLDDHLVPGLAEDLPLHDVADRLVRLIGGAADDHAFALGQAIGLDDQRRGDLGDVVVRVVRVLEDVERRRRDAVLLHDALGEDLAALQLGRGARRAEDLEPFRRQFVGDAHRERVLGADDGEVHALFADELHEADEVVRAERDAFGLPRDSGVAGRAIDFLHQRRLGDFPDERMLAAAAADDEDLHVILRQFRAANPTCGYCSPGPAQAQAEDGRPMMRAPAHGKCGI